MIIITTNIIVIYKFLYKYIYSILLFLSFFYSFTFVSNAATTQMFYKMRLRLINAVDFH